MVTTTTLSVILVALPAIGVQIYMLGGLNIKAAISWLGYKRKKQEDICHGSCL